jgi:hypothetical protein
MSRAFRETDHHRFQKKRGSIRTSHVLLRDDAEALRAQLEREELRVLLRGDHAEAKAIRARLLELEELRGSSEVVIHLSRHGSTETKASLGVLRVGARILPQAVRVRWVEEWRGDLTALERDRIRHLLRRGGTEPKASLGVLRVGARILPQAVRARWVEEWRGELAALESRRDRIRFVRQMLWGIPRMALVLRQPEPERPRG